MKTGFPAEKNLKLINRKKACEEGLLEEFCREEAIKNETMEFKLSYEPHPKIPYIAGCLELSRNFYCYTIVFHILR